MYQVQDSMSRPTHLHVSVGRFGGAQSKAHIVAGAKALLGAALQQAAPLIVRWAEGQLAGVQLHEAVIPGVEQHLKVSGINGINNKRW